MYPRSHTANWGIQGSYLLAYCLVLFGFCHCYRLYSPHSRQSHLNFQMRSCHSLVYIIPWLPMRGRIPSRGLTWCSYYCPFCKLFVCPPLMLCCCHPAHLQAYARAALAPLLVLHSLLPSHRSWGLPRLPSLSDLLEFLFQCLVSHCQRNRLVGSGKREEIKWNNLVEWVDQSLLSLKL